MSLKIKVEHQEFFYQRKNNKYKSCRFFFFHLKSDKLNNWEKLEETFEENFLPINSECHNIVFISKHPLLSFGNAFLLKQIINERNSKSC